MTRSIRESVDGLLAAEREMEGMELPTSGITASRSEKERASSSVRAQRLARAVAASKTSAARRTLGRVGALQAAQRRTIAAANLLGFAAARHGLLLGRYTVYDVTAGQPGVYLGEILEGATTLAGISLADGTHVLEIRTTRHFWEEARSPVRLTVTVASGSPPVADTLPVISGLAATTIDGETIIAWDADGDGYGVTADGFRLWYNPTSPVPVGGAADDEVEWSSGKGSYRAYRAQAAAEYVAVAAYAGATQGPATELALPWSGSVSSPASQQADHADIPDGSMH